MEKPIIPLTARRVLYAVFVVAMIATPFVNIMTGDEFAQAFVTATSIIGGFAGVTALAHPTGGDGHAKGA